MEEIKTTGEVGLYDDDGDSIVKVKVGRLAFFLLTDIGSSSIIKAAVTKPSSSAPSLSYSQPEPPLLSSLDSHYSKDGVPKPLSLTPWLSGGGAIPFPPLTPEAVATAVRIKFIDIEQTGIERGVWRKLLIEDGVVEKILESMNDFAVVGNYGVVLSKYGAHEVNRNDAVRNAQRVAARHSRTDGVGKLKIAAGGRGVELQLCSENDHGSKISCYKV